jgi:phospholipase C
MVRTLSRQALALALAGTLALSGCDTGFKAINSSTPVTSSQVIKHVVVIFDENESFDHYFGTYPNATNPSGETMFTAAAGTPTPNAYLTNPTLLTANPNSTNASNGSGKTNPFRLDPSQAFANTQSHSYNPEQLAFDNGAMDLFPLSVGAADSAALAGTNANAAIAQTTGLTMGYFDGNTVTALWNYAQHYALSDRYFGTTFGGSTLGAINLISGQTNGVVNDAGSSADIISDGNGGYSLTDDSEPTGDVCSGTSATVHMTGRNIGDLLTAANVTWGWFQGGFNLTLTNTATNTTGCARKSFITANHGGTPFSTPDYVSRHEPFQYYATTQNLNHTRPSSTAAIGTNADAANHQYDTNDFLTALNAGNMPAVSFLKPPAYQDSHASNSDPLDEQTWLVTMINAIEQSSFWPNTAIIIAYDDSDGWYDHMNWVVNGSNTAQDSAICINATGTAASTAALPGVNGGTLHAQGRCGHGPRLPLLVISPWVDKNTINSAPIDQTSITRFIEDTFLGSQRIGGGSYDAIANAMDPIFDFTSSTPPNPNVVLLNSTTGVVTSGN